MRRFRLYPYLVGATVSLALAAPGVSIAGGAGGLEEDLGLRTLLAKRIVDAVMCSADAPSDEGCPGADGRADQPLPGLGKDAAGDVRAGPARDRPDTREEGMTLTALLASDPRTPAAPTEERESEAEHGNEEEGSHPEPEGHYRGTLTSRRSGKPIKSARLTFENLDTETIYEAVTDDQGRYEVRMPTGSYRVEIRVGRKIYGGTGTFREEVPGRLWYLDFALERKLRDQNFELDATASSVTVRSVYDDRRITPDYHWTEFWVFLAGVIGVAALAD